LSRDYPKIADIESGVSIHATTEGNRTKIYTNDHRHQKTLHQATVVSHQPTADFPHAHLEQKSVDTVKGANPRNHATQTIYNFWKAQSLPLRSSNMQFRLGHEMWGRLVDMALNDGKLVYRHDGKELHKVTQQNCKYHVESSFGTSPDKRKDHLILSHAPLDGVGK
jgi:hypothetical protein